MYHVEFIKLVKKTVAKLDKYTQNYDFKLD